MKACLGCGIEKPITEYHTKRGKPQPRCKSCRAEYMRKHYLANHSRERALRKAWYEKNKLSVCKKLRDARIANPEEIRLQQRIRRYGLTKEKYLEVLESQNHACAICERTFTQTPAIDHCHGSLIVRGLLCDNCNTGFGLFKEDSQILKRATAYAKKYKK